MLNFSKDSVETAYSFFHQKQRVYQYSSMEWQREDIAQAIASYVEQMNQELYGFLSQGRPDFLLDSRRFGDDLKDAVRQLESMLSI